MNTAVRTQNVPFLPPAWAALLKRSVVFTAGLAVVGVGSAIAVALLTYKEGVDSFRVTDRLSDSDRATLMGGSLQQIYGWSPKK